MTRSAVGTWSSHEVRALIWTANVCLVRRNYHVDWYPGLRRENSVRLPIAEHPTQEGIPAIEARQVIDKGCNESMANVPVGVAVVDRKSTRLNSSHVSISYA